MARFGVVVSLFCVVVISTALSQTVPSSDPQAIKLATQSLLALTKGNPVVDVTLTVDVASIAGSDYFTGTGVLQAKGVALSRVDLNLGPKRRIEIHALSDGFPDASWADEKGAAKVAQHNCWTDAVWFFPALSSLAQIGNANFTFTYVGQEKYSDLPVEHLRTVQSVAGDPKGTLRPLTMEDIYLDPGSLLPLAITSKVHPDNDVSANIAQEVRFAKYQTVNGIQLPFHVQELLNGTVVLDLLVTNVEINSGVPDSTFTAQ